MNNAVVYLPPAGIVLGLLSLWGSVHCRFINLPAVAAGLVMPNAVIVLKESGVAAVVVKSAARIWYRNAVNLALPVMFCQTLPDQISEGAEVEIDFEAGTIRETATGAIHRGEAPSAFVLGMYREGGIKPRMRKKQAARRSEGEPHGL